MPKRILIVDDDPSILRTLKRVLEKNGYDVDTSETAKEALDKLARNHYDLALVDVILPDMKGTDLLVIAKKELNQTVKFVITGYPSAEIGAKARESGADAFILKPVKMPELLSIIQVFLNENQAAPYEYQGEEKFTLSNI
jgi:DNA-binding response OmpR family regulator